jgi:hypothetical protein
MYSITGGPHSKASSNVGTARSKDYLINYLLPNWAQVTLDLFTVHLTRMEFTGHSQLLAPVRPLIYKSLILFKRSFKLNRIILKANSYNRIVSSIQFVLSQ